MSASAEGGKRRKRKRQEDLECGPSAKKPRATASGSQKRNKQQKGQPISVDVECSPEKKKRKKKKKKTKEKDEGERDEGEGGSGEQGRQQRKHKRKTKQKHLDCRSGDVEGEGRSAGCARSTDSILVEGRQLDDRGEECGSYCAPSPVTSFATAPFHEKLLALLDERFSEPMPIQAQTWPIAREGRDMVCVAKTGSGKTLAFLLPLLQSLLDRGAAAAPAPAVPTPIALILAPTRELAKQIQKDAHAFGKGVGLRSVCVYGGTPMHAQRNALRGGANAFPHLLVSTPGRLIDLTKAGEVELGQVAIVVVDEADRMLDLGFAPQLHAIARNFPTGPPARHTLLFSATWPPHVRTIAAAFLGPHPVRVFVGGARDGLVANESVAQSVHVVVPEGKAALLWEVVEALPASHKTLVFVRRRRRCDELATEARERGIECDVLHGEREQRERNAAIRSFRGESKHSEGNINLLIATDVAARGLDVPDITHVINYDFPLQRGAGGIEDYVHRCGRTGRAGRTGHAVTFFTYEDSESARAFVALLQAAHQTVPPPLLALADKAKETSGDFAAAAAKRAAKKERRMKAREVREGDWQCGKCKANVFAAKTACFKCNTPR